MNYSELAKMLMKGINPTAHELNTVQQPTMNDYWGRITGMLGKPAPEGGFDKAIRGMGLPWQQVQQQPMQQRQPMSAPLPYGQRQRPQVQMGAQGPGMPWRGAMPRNARFV